MGGRASGVEEEFRTLPRRQRHGGAVAERHHGCVRLLGRGVPPKAVEAEEMRRDRRIVAGHPRFASFIDVEEQVVVVVCVDEEVRVFVNATHAAGRAKVRRHQHPRSADVVGPHQA